MNDDFVKKITGEAFNILLHAGNAREKMTEGLNCLENLDFDKCETALDEAHLELIEAHKIQTGVIQENIEDGTNTTLLFTHAQDTLMTMNSEMKLLKIIINMYKKMMLINTSKEVE